MIAEIIDSMVFSSPLHEPMTRQQQFNNEWNRSSTKWIITKLNTTDMAKRLQLYFARWKGKISENEDNSGGRTKEAKVNAESTRNVKRFTCGVDTYGDQECASFSAIGMST